MNNQKDFPVNVKSYEYELENEKFEMVCMGFSNSIVMIITQLGKVGQLLQTTLDSFQPHMLLENEVAPSTTKFLLGYSADERSHILELFSSQLIDFIKKENPKEQRKLILGLGLKNQLIDVNNGKKVLDIFYTMAKECKVW